MIAEPLVPCAAWSNDCQGKKDYDGPLLRISTRYWPGPDGGGSMTFDTGTGKMGTLPYGKQPSAKASILLLFGGENAGDYLVWREQEFEALTPAEVKAQVERWVQEQFNDVMRLLGGRAAFREDA